MTQYPPVTGELATLDLMVAGASIARYGDGEFAIAEGRSIRTQRHDAELARRLRGILHGEAGACLVGIPNILSDLPAQKAKFWEKYKRCAALLSQEQRYVSSFVSRPDNAPWLDTPSYWARLEALWAGQDVTLVRGSDPGGTGGISLLAADLTSARSVWEIVAPAVNAWAGYSDLLQEIGRPTVALLCLGPTATVLAADLSSLGVHALDLGHVGLFRRRHLQGLPMARTKRERALSV